MSEDVGAAPAVGHFGSVPPAPPVAPPPAPPVWAPPVPPVSMTKPASAPPGAPLPPLAPTPPPPPPEQPARRRPVRTAGGIIGVIVILGIKLFAVAGVSHFLHGASPIVIFVVILLVAIFVRRFARFLGR